MLFCFHCNQLARSAFPLTSPPFNIQRSPCRRHGLLLVNYNTTQNCPGMTAGSPYRRARSHFKFRRHDSRLTMGVTRMCLVQIRYAWHAFITVYGQTDRTVFSPLPSMVPSASTHVTRVAWPFDLYIQVVCGSTSTIIVSVILFRIPDSESVLYQCQTLTRAPVATSSPSPICIRSCPTPDSPSSNVPFCCLWETSSWKAMATMTAALNIHKMTPRHAQPRIQIAKSGASSMTPSSSRHLLTSAPDSNARQNHCLTRTSRSLNQAWTM